MSVLGEFRRVAPEELERIRAVPELARDRADRLPAWLDLDRAWERLAALMDRAGFPVNPISGGEPFPDERHAFGRSLTPAQVATAATHLARTPFGELEPHLRPLLDGEGWFQLPEQPLLEPFVPTEADFHPVDDETARAIRDTLAEAYAELAQFFTAAARDGQCTVFWAA
ncbi:hypothetical protein Ade02nite_46750 [Paractinoplanes deccanensis]|uniref:DUF1877 family protein n=1 Tax=Paractinoplanes deccanensis TaxID=113561 RepID=A0ABQ3Y7S5_9ACTN|nr:DUF1877 family protein [Actinoplanes deccanensis]GID76034.1 hypothetical protein Ade02nite_46750 [Actinoplanes deccanensis]